MYLTKHQREILKLLRQGHSYTETAKLLNSKKDAIGANLRFAAKRNGYSSISDLRKATQHIDLDHAGKKISSHVPGIRITKAGTFRVSIPHGKYRNKHLGTRRTYAEAVALRMEGEKLYHGTNHQSLEQSNS